MSAAAWNLSRPQETRHASTPGFAVAAMSVGMLALYSQFFVFPIFGDGPGIVAASGVIRAIYLPAYIIGLVLVAGAPLSFLAALARQPFLLLVLAMVALSYAWSIAPDQTLRRAVAVYFTTLGGVAIAVRYRWAQMAEIIGTCFASLAVLSLVVCLAAPSIGVMHEIFPGAWRGLWAEKNAFGGNMALGCIIMFAAAALNPRRALIWAAFAALALGLVLMSTSKTSLVSAMLGMGVIGAAAFARRGPAAAVAVVWTGVLGAALVAGVALFAPDQFFSLLGKDATFTGRTQIWAAALRQIAQRPWTGFGYGVVWTEEGNWAPLAQIVKEAGFKPQHAHNAWIEQWLGQGLVGVWAFGLMLAQAFVLALVSVFRHPGALLAAPILVVYTLMSLTESVGVIYHDLRWVLFVVVAVKLAWPDERIGT